ncbi:hydrolase [Fictibacillus sp. b24]|uniref:hydrolase n=1 Tax=Fictibacillus sp. b24 TaxID=3055863 RepID=UPI0025A1BD78|nr:hydrolase [Fictibacillus sp. b24]MDM5316741.1 hydrolase [Fictibacillus sp. b24]
MGLLKNGCGCNNAAAAAEENNCVGCACDQLRNLRVGTEIESILIKGKELEDLDDINFISFDSKTCCATFIARRNSDRVIFTLDCRKIDAIFFELED